MEFDAWNAAERLLARCRQDDFGGYDPFDHLNSELFRRTVLCRIPIARLAWLQVGKRSPINLRPLARVGKMRNPKGVALFILGLCEMHMHTGAPGPVREAVELGQWLMQARSDPAVWRHYCWGYHFDWQARAFFVPRGTPNVITTVYVARALRACGELAGRSDFIDAADDAAAFIADSMLTGAGSGRYIAYIPGEGAFVHNASLWGAAWCVHAGTRRRDSRLVDIGAHVALNSCAMQEADGSWRYGTLPHHRFVDGFHTGYNLEAIDLINREVNDKRLEACLRAGCDYYVRHLFDEEGTPKYYANNLYPIDTHNFAQAIITLLRVIGGAEAERMAHRVMERAVELLYLPRSGLFAYQRGRFLLSRINYSRWTQAWAFLALAIYNRRFAEERHAAG